MTEDLPGLDPFRTARWLTDRIDHVGVLSFELMAAGGSNLTYRVTDAANNAWALRRPPVGRALATAHDIDREWRILEALHATDTGVPVPEPVARCEDAEVTGSPFFVMSFVDGTILRTEADGRTLDRSAGQAAAGSLIAVQAALHDLDPRVVGLGDLGRETGYVERQLARWKAQVDRAGVRDLPLLDDLHRRLAASTPSETDRATLVHGDYRFDNVVLDAGHRVAAVLDWELCTLGDPVADACWSLLYWADPGDPYAFLPSSPTLAPTVPDRAWARDRYEQLSGRVLDHWDWFTAFGWWKMACIVEGVHARRLKGSRGGMRVADAGTIGDSVLRMLEVADETASRARI